MWLGHFIKHLMCIGGELEHHKSSPMAGQKNKAVNWQGVYIRRPLVPVCGWNRDQRGHHFFPVPATDWDQWLWARSQAYWSRFVSGTGTKGVTIWSRFQPQTGTNGCGPGARRIGPGSCLEPGPNGSDEPGPMAHEARPARWPHEPGPMAPMGPGS